MAYKKGIMPWVTHPDAWFDSIEEIQMWLLTGEPPMMKLDIAVSTPSNSILVYDYDGSGITQANWVVSTTDSTS